MPNHDISSPNRRNFRRQSCALCVCEDKFDFHVPDDIWWNVVPAEYRQRVLCLSCFDQFACQKGIDYANSIETLYFAGEQAKLKFESVSAKDG
jgi:hypothetical protein